MFDFLSDFLSSMIGVSTGNLDTKKIDNNIELLKQQGWFKKIYDDEKYHRLFITNRHVRAYLQNTTRVKKFIRSEEAQRKLLLLLDKQLKS
ncbi:hypothetical protein SAMN05444673_4011 [Bacillus sp. OV166]|uniref:hypothetical protein n=1 Tax=Bacillus sp. OV166 TaxID=1882763 RepID=UPI000A2AB40F|nr:hypothetical protein [Bacillus sp. OV166]SMQ80863.1 hypothetical protein SAMN05444673_4011 [Bacillus sp. OV166]